MFAFQAMALNNELMKGIAHNYMVASVGESRNYIIQIQTKRLDQPFSVQRLPGLVLVP